MGELIKLLYVNEQKGVASTHMDDLLERMREITTWYHHVQNEQRSFRAVGHRRRRATVVGVDEPEYGWIDQSDLPDTLNQYGRMLSVADRKHKALEVMVAGMTREQTEAQLKLGPEQVKIKLALQLYADFQPTPTSEPWPSDTNFCAGAVKLVTEVVEEYRNSPDFGPNHKQTLEYERKLREWSPVAMELYVADYKEAVLRLTVQKKWNELMQVQARYGEWLIVLSAHVPGVDSS